MSMYSDVESYELPLTGKKTNKPLMEKKRRARINRCLSELKDILIKDNHASAGHAKWEKADILEMTVDYVRKLREHKGLPALPKSSDCSESATTTTEENDDVPLAASKSPASVSSPPSTSSTEFTDPSEAKRRRKSSPETLPSVLPPVPHAPTAIYPGFNHFAQQFFAMQQLQQHMKMAAAAPAIIPGAAALPSPVALHIPWRM